MRLIFAPQYPAALRYQEWFLGKFPQEFFENFDEVVTLGIDSSIPVQANTEHFAPLEQACEWEFKQIKQYLNMRLYEDDILLLMDISFPGFFPQVLYHKKPKKVFAFCHATSINKYDYFSYPLTRYEKFKTEQAIAIVCDKVFVGSHYHKRRLGWSNIVVTYLPYPEFGFEPLATIATRNIVSVARNSNQKRDLEKEMYLERQLGMKIERPNANSWVSYYKFLQESKVMIITSKEETFGYQIVDAVLNGCVPIAPNGFSYPELLPETYLYNNDKEMVNSVRLALKGQLSVPKLLCDWEMQNFYRNIIEIMKG